MLSATLGSSSISNCISYREQILDSIRRKLKTNWDLLSDFPFKTVSSPSYLTLFNILHTIILFLYCIIHTILMTSLDWWHLKNRSIFFKIRQMIFPSKGLIQCYLTTLIFEHFRLTLKELCKQAKSRSNASIIMLKENLSAVEKVDQPYSDVNWKNKVSGLVDFIMNCFLLVSFFSSPSVIYQH